MLIGSNFELIEADKEQFNIPLNAFEGCQHQHFYFPRRIN